MTILTQAERLPGTKIVEYTLELRPGTVVKLFLPIDLTKREVERLNRYLMALAEGWPDP